MCGRSGTTGTSVQPTLAHQHGSSSHDSSVWNASSVQFLQEVQSQNSPHSWHHYEYYQNWRYTECPVISQRTVLRIVVNPRHNTNRMLKTNQITDLYAREIANHANVKYFMNLFNF